MKEKQILLELCNLTKTFPLPKTRLFEPVPPVVRAVDGVSLNIYEGETVGLVGESGCGKSTLGRVLLHLYPPTDGMVRYFGGGQPGGVDLARLTGDTLRGLRQELQMIFQDPYASLNPRMTVGQIIGDGPAAHGLYPAGSEALRSHLQQVMASCSLEPYLLHRYPHQLSGGQRQRVAIARVLALRPRFVVCDEAVSALDVSIQSQILNLLQDLKQQNGLTYLFISHDLSVVRYVSDRVGVMYLGRLVELADTADLFAAPMHPYTRALLSAIPTLDRAPDWTAVLPQGEPPSPANPPLGCAFHTRCPYADTLCLTLRPLWEEAAPGHFAACHHRSRLPVYER